MATRYSLVVPVYRNEETIPDLLAALAGIDRALGGGLEVVFVVDGSPDRSLAAWSSRCRARASPRRSSRCRATSARSRRSAPGLAEASGPYFAVMAADLQEPPELAVEFFRRLEQDACDVVCGVRAARDDPWRSRLASNAVLGRLSPARAAGDAAGRRRRLRLQRSPRGTRSSR